jgi:uncharacterized protein (UPF0297 family)
VTLIEGRGSLLSSDTARIARKDDASMDIRHIGGLEDVPV